MKRKYMKTQYGDDAFCLKNYLIHIFLTSAKVGLSCDIKSFFRKSVDKKSQTFNCIFHPALLHDDFIPLNNTFRSQKNISNSRHY